MKIVVDGRDHYAIGMQSLKQIVLQLSFAHPQMASPPLLCTAVDRGSFTLLLLETVDRKFLQISLQNLA